MHPAVLQVAHRQLQFGPVAAQEAQRDLRRLLHHVTQLAGQGQPGSARLRVGQGRLDVEHVPARAGHREAGGDTGDGGTALGRVLGGLGHVVRPADQLPQVARGHGEGQLPFAQFVLGRDLAQQPRDRPLQVAHAGLARVLAGQPAQRALVDRDLVLVQPGTLQLAREQVVAGDDDLLVLGVAVEADQLHAVEQRLGDGFEHVGRGEEHHVGQVELDLQVVVAEGVVLRRVQHLEQGRRRVAAEVGADLVDLVEQDDRVHRTGLLDRADDPAGQRADVGAAVAADLGLVADAAEGDADELAAHRVGDGLAEAGLADAGRAHEGQDGAPAPAADDAEAPVAAPLAHRQVLGDALLHVLQPRVLGVQDGLGALDVVGVLGALAPRHLQDRVEPGADPGTLR